MKRDLSAWEYFLDKKITAINLALPTNSDALFFMKETDTNIRINGKLACLLQAKKFLSFASK